MSAGFGPSEPFQIAYMGHLEFIYLSCGCRVLVHICFEEFCAVLNFLLKKIKPGEFSRNMQEEEEKPRLCRDKLAVTFRFYIGIIGD